MNKTVKSGAQKRREKKVAKLHEAASHSYSLTSYFSSAACSTGPTGATSNSSEFDDKHEDQDEYEDAKPNENDEGILCIMNYL